MGFWSISQTALAPGTICDGSQRSCSASELKVGDSAMTERVTVAVDEATVAPMVAVRFEVTDATVAVKLAVVLLRGTSTAAGTVTAETSLLDKETAVPFPGAALESVTVHVVVDDAVRMVLAHSREIGGSVTLNVNVLLVPLKMAVMVAV